MKFLINIIMHTRKTHYYQSPSQNNCLLPVCMLIIATSYVLAHGMHWMKHAVFKTVTWKILTSTHSSCNTMLDIHTKASITIFVGWQYSGVQLYCQLPSGFNLITFLDPYHLYIANSKASSMLKPGIQVSILVRDRNMIHIYWYYCVNHQPSTKQVSF